MSEQAGKTPGVQAVKAKMSGHELADFFGRFRSGMRWRASYFYVLALTVPQEMHSDR